jgi:hypothetical protein
LVDIDKLLLQEFEISLFLRGIVFVVEKCLHLLCAVDRALRLPLDVTYLIFLSFIIGLGFTSLDK